MKTLGGLMIAVGALSLWAGLAYLTIHTLRSTYEVTVPVTRLETELRSNYPNIGLFELPPWIGILFSTMPPKSADNATSFLQSLKGDEHIFISDGYLAQTRTYISQSKEGEYQLYQEKLAVPPARGWGYDSKIVQGSPETIVVKYDNEGFVVAFGVIGAYLLIAAIGMIWAMIWAFACDASRSRAKQEAENETP